MRIARLEANTVGATGWYVVDTARAPFELSVGVSAPGTATYSLEYTYVDVGRGETTAPGDVFTAIDSASGAAEASFDAPIAAVRLNVAAGAGVVARIIQSGL